MSTLSFSFQSGAIVITGAAGGIGLAVARGAADAGFPCIVALDRDAAALERLRQEIPAVVPVACDLNEVGMIPALIRSIEDSHGPLRYLVNNAGRWDGAPIEELEEVSWRRHFALNVDAPFALIRACTPGFRAAGGGAVVNVSSRNALRSSAGMAAYDASKAALNALTRTAAGELASSGIRVNAVMPGVVATPGEMAASDKDFADAYSRLIPLARYARSEEVAAAVLFLLSDGASFITGEALLVDGGQMACQNNAEFRKLLHPKTSP